MTEESGPKVSAAYRGMGAEEPPAAVDAAIRAAARRRPQRFYAPLATAAVIALAVGVTLHLQIEQPGLEAPVVNPQKEAAPAAQPPAPVVADSTPRPAPERAKPRAEATAKPAEPRAFTPDPATPASPAPAPSAAGSVAGAAAERGERDARADRTLERARPSAAPESMAKRSEATALSLAETPERELERVAALRVQGRHEEADRALAGFRKRYPDYRIPEEMRLRVERR